MKRISRYKIDRVLSGELPTSTLDHAEKKYLVYIRGRYFQLRRRMESYYSSMPMLGKLDRVLHRILNFEYGIVFSGLLLIAATSTYIAYSGMRDSISRAFARGPQDRFKSVSSYSGSTQVELYINRKNDKMLYNHNASIRRGDILSFTAKSYEIKSAFLQAIQIEGDRPLNVFPVNGVISEKVFLIPTWEIPFSYFVSSINTNSNFVIAISNKPFDQQELLGIIKRSMKRSSHTRFYKNSELWIDLHFFYVDDTKK